MVDEMFGNEEKKIETDKQNEENVENETQEEEGTYEPPNMFISTVKLVFALAIIIILIYFVLKIVNGKNKTVQKTRSLENLGGIPLGTNKSLQTVRIGERIYVIGVGDTVEMLLEVTDEKTKSELMANNPTDYNPTNLVKTFLPKTKKVETNDKFENSQTQTFTNMFQKELESLVKGRQKVRKDFTKKEGDRHE